MAINDRDFYASHGISFDVEEMQIEYTKRVIKQAKIEVLTELQLEIENLKLDYPVGECEHPALKIKTTAYQTKTTAEIKHDCAELIQQKINVLKAETEEIC